MKITDVETFVVGTDWRNFTMVIQEYFKDGGYFAPPNGPGLGLVLNEEVIEAHPKRDVHFNLFAEGWEKRATTGTPGTQR